MIDDPGGVWAARGEQPDIMPILPPAAPAALTPLNVTRIARVTGATPPGETLPNPNHTDERDAILGTDLGILWDAGDGTVMIAFGDTYGDGWGSDGAGPPTADWRSNVLALSRDADPTHGLVFTAMIQDRPGHAAELLPARRDAHEWTVIPTAGVTVGRRHFLHFMSVREWGPPSDWHTNEAGLAFSDDGGQTWTRSASAVWPNTPVGDDPFQQAAFVHDGRYVYLLGTPNGRRGRISLARVPADRLLDRAAYGYWDGRAWRVGDEAAAVPVADGPAGEVSVVYNSHFRRWLMVSLDVDRAALVLREAAALSGPWSAPSILASAADYPGLYGGFLDPRHNGGTDLYFTLSLWRPYNVFWMHAVLRPGTS